VVSSRRRSALRRRSRYRPDTGRLFEQLATIIGPIGEQRVDHLALDHHARVGAQAGAAHEILDVAQAARRAVEQVLALAGAHEAAREHHFLERHGQVAVGVVEVQRDFGHVHRLARRRAVEDDVFHLRAAHHARALLTQHPAHRIGHVGLAAAVRTDNGRDAAIEHELRVIGERLESMHFELRQPH
jgi:hypothetical protein